MCLRRRLASRAKGLKEVNGETVEQDTQPGSISRTGIASQTL